MGLGPQSQHVAVAARIIDFVVVVVGPVASVVDGNVAFNIADVAVAAGCVC